MSSAAMFSRLQVAPGAMLIAGALIVAPAQAQSLSDRVIELEKKLERTMKMLEESKQTERSSEPKADPPPVVRQGQAAAAPEERLQAVEQQMQQISTSLATRSNTHEGVPLHGFADAGYAWRSKGLPKGANIGSVDFYLTPSLGSRVKSLVELNIEVSDAGEVAVDLERLQIGYTFSDQLTTWTGRFHAPYGYWNTAFHHGAQFQTAILRPRFLDFEDKGGILPAHLVGLWGTGSIGAGTGKITYDVFAGNSPRIGMEGGLGTGVLNPNIASSTNHNAAVGFNTGYQFGGTLDGLKLGVHGMQYRVVDDDVAANTTVVKFLGGYAVYVENNWEVLSEYYRFRNNDKTNGTGAHQSWAAYMQAGRTIGSWTPYVRFERTALDQSDSYFSQQASGGSYDRGMLGVRYELDRNSAVKFEMGRTKFTDRDELTYREGRVQFAVRF
jgi:hypothetical protein